MCLDHTPESNAFAQWLLKVGAGSDLTPDKSIQLPDNMCLPQNNIQGSINAIYPDIDLPNREDQFFLKCTILSATNDKVNHLNQVILDSFPGEQSMLMSADTVHGDNTTLYTTEFLNSINASGLPLAHLTLKPGCPLMLLRNINPTNGLCNGTHMILLKIRPMVLRCRILGG